MSEEALELCVTEALSPLGLARARDTPLLSFITKTFVRRIYKVLGYRDKEQRGGRSKQAALARIVNDMLHGSIPDVESLEASGQGMCSTAVKNHGGNVDDREKQLKRTKVEASRQKHAEALAVLHRELCVCKHGATTPQVSGIAPVPVPERRPARTDVDIDRDGIILELKTKLAAAEQLPNVAKRQRDRADAACVDAALERERAAQLQAQLQRLKAELVAKVAAAQKEESERATARVTRAEERAAAAKAKLELEIEKRQQAAADVLKARGHVVSALEEAGRVEQARQKLESDFKAAVERRVEQETSQLRDDVWAEFEEEFEDAQETLAAAEETGKARKKRERAEARRAAVSAERLERAKAAEHEVQALGAEIEELREKLQGAAIRREAADADSDDDAPANGVEGGRSACGRFTKFDWRTRRLFHGWLARRIPPASAGRSYMDSAKHFAPEKKVRQPSLDWIRKLRAETTILGEACAALQVLCAKRIVSFGFDESTKLGDGVASTNLQIETMDAVRSSTSFFVAPSSSQEGPPRRCATRWSQSCSRIAASCFANGRMSTSQSAARVAGRFQIPAVSAIINWVVR
jgi:hypothetical protein